MVASCDPIKEEKDFDVTNITADEVLSGATFSQYSDEACTTPAADGNFIKFDCPKTSSVTIYYLKPDGSESVLSYGKPSGVFRFVPKRGSEPNQTVYFRYINQDGKEVTASKQFTLLVAADLDPEMKFLVSNAGKKKWVWDTSVNGQAWGNMAYACGPGEDFFAAGANQWWGCTPDLLWSQDEGGQYGHTDGDATKAGEGNSNAYMILDEDGVIISYDANGSKLREGTFKVTGYDGQRHDVGGNAWDLGKFTTSAPAVLYPYKINGGGTTVTDFEILGLTDDQLCLVYPGTASAGAWAEATFWRFTAADNEDLLYKDWTWDTSVNGQAWGNMAYACGPGVDFFAAGANQWWGCAPELLWSDGEGGQYGHTDGDNAKAGEGDSNAYMTITDDGKITPYDANGTALRSGSVSVELFDKRQDVGGNPWHIGTFKTTDPAVMYPYMINGGGTKVTDFEILGLTGTQLVLVYPGTASPGAWAEATFWRFKKK